MTEKTAPWWRSFVGKRRKAARESAAILEQDLRSHGSAGSAGSAPHVTPAPPDQRLASPALPASEEAHSLPSDETYDDSAVQPTFSEKSSRRNLTVSRSGRFKEKKRARSSLPHPHEDDAQSAALRSADPQAAR